MNIAPARKLGLTDIADIRAYERERVDFRKHVIALKQRRRVSVGPHITFVFENRDTIRFQIQEMARVEKLYSDGQIETELNIYNPLIPEPGHLAATMFIELTSEPLLREWLPKLVNVERSVVLRFGDEEVSFTLDAAHEAQLTRDDITSAVHYVHLSLTAVQIERFATGLPRLAIEHPTYSYETPLGPDTIAELLGDLREDRHVGIDTIGGWPSVLRPLTQGGSLSVEVAGVAMQEILDGNASPAQIAAFIVALRMKGETVDEMTGMVRAMYNAATPLDIGPLVDTAIDIVGAGGSPSRQQAALNVSTMACFVAAGAGAVVCKHGNRKASSTSGAFDFLAAIGIPDDLTPDGVARCVREAGVGFAFARTFHPAMRFAAPVRAEIGIPTVFNILGPLANPSRLRRQVIGVSDTIQADKMIRVLEANGAHHVLVVTGDGPLDELALTGESNIHELVDGKIRTYGITPESVGLDRVAAIDGGDAARNASLFAAMLDGERGPVRDIVALNAAAGLLVAGIAPDLAHGVEAAFASIDSGAAGEAHQRLLDVIAAIRA